MAPPLRIACVQGPGRSAAPDEMLDALSIAAEEARRGAAQLLLCAEMNLTGYAIGAERVAELAEPRNGPMTARVREIALQNGMAILAGFPERDGDAIYNTTILIGADGTEIAAYRKTHLFGELDRDQFSPGAHPPPVVDFGGLKVGLLICYDVEFPETVRGLALRGADLVLVPTALMRPAEIVAETVVVSRAFENQVFLAYINRCDHEAAFDYCGLSCVVGPDGTVLARAGAGPEMIFADIDIARVQSVRRETWHLRDRRPDLYTDLTKPTVHGKDSTA